MGHSFSLGRHCQSHPTFYATNSDGDTCLEFLRFHYSEEKSMGRHLFLSHSDYLHFWSMDCHRIILQGGSLHATHAF